MSLFKGRAKFWIPDCSAWEDCAFQAPVSKAGLLRVGNTRYFFGGVGTDGYPTATIWAATDPIDGSLPTFTNTNRTVPGASRYLRVVIIGDTIYAYGTRWHGFGPAYVWTAPLSDPLTWTQTSTAFVERDGAPIVIVNGVMYIFGGTDSSGNNISTAQMLPTSTPFASWVQSSDPGNSIFNAPSVSAAVCGNRIVLAGVNAAGSSSNYSSILTIETGNLVADFSNSNITNHIGQAPNATPTQNTQDHELFHNGNELVLLGTGQHAVVYGDPQRPLLTWPQASTSAAATTDAKTIWAGKDGRLYWVLASGNALWRSGRKAVYVSPADVAGTDPYAPLPGVLEDGTPAVVSRQVRMGNPPWIVQHPGAF